MAAAMTSASHAWSAWSSDGFDGEADDDEQRQGDHAAEPFEHDRGERDRGRADVLRAAGDAHDVAADRRRQHVAHELPGEVVAGEGARAARARRRRRSTCCQRQADRTMPTTRRQDRDAEQQRGSQRVRVGRCDPVEVGDSREQHDEEHARSPAGAARPSTSPPERRATAGSPGIRASLRAGAVPISAAVVVDADGRDSRDHGRDADHDGRRRRARGRGVPATGPGLLLVHGFGGREGGLRRPRADARRATTRVVTFDHRGHGDERQARPTRPPTRSTGSSPTRSRSPTRPGSTTSACSATRWAAWSRAGSRSTHTERVDALVMMDTSRRSDSRVRSRAHRHRRDVALTEGKEALKDLLDFVSVARDARVQARARGAARLSPSSRRASGTDLSEIMWGAIARELGTQPDDLPAMAACACPDARHRRRAGRAVRRTRRSAMAEAIPGARARRDSRRRSLAAVREPERVDRRAHRLPRRRCPPTARLVDVEAHGGRLAVEVLRRHGVDAMFTLSGGHLFVLYDGAVQARPAARRRPPRADRDVRGRGLGEGDAPARVRGAHRRARASPTA